MHLQHNVSLLPYNTFGIDVTADYFAAITDPSDLADISTLPHPVHVLGGGSNILLTAPVAGLVLHNQLKGIELIRENADHVWLRVQSGEVWHGFVLHAIENGWGGIENLALIPGTVGAAPIQNIGAYGVEVRTTIEEVTFLQLEENTVYTISNEECQFGYRDSIFKNALSCKVFVTSVVFRLNKHPEFNTGYGAIEQELQLMGITVPTVKAIAQAVINIRTSKLPDPKQIGNAGSFFKNPTVPAKQYRLLVDAYPEMPHYAVDDDRVKIPAAWLIEQCGWKGFRREDAGVHARQALVIVNYGSANGNDLWQLSGEILTSVKEKFGIELEREVQVW
jgi:UDP-N-acetylmuramate dehydrogenase